ncbi:MAG: Fic family protein [Flavobacteriales bacterium]|nr:Fic family protein [Flavobacteriales bacterium]
MELPEYLASLETRKNELQAALPMKPERERELWQKLRLEWNYNSNHIEGNTLTYGETILLFLKEVMPGGHTTREIFEMQAHDVAIGMVREWVKEQDRPLREGDIRDLNRILLKEPFFKEAITAEGLSTQVQVVPGEYKKHGNVVRQPDGTLFEYSKPEEVQMQMHELMEWYHDERALHPIQKAAVLHHRFILIHPFGDGNGRTARLLVNYHLMIHGYMPVVVKSADKANYLLRLKQADAGDAEPFIEYMAQQAEWSMDLALRAARDLPIEEPADWRKQAELLLRSTTDIKQKATDREARWRKHIIDSIQLNYPIIRQEIEDKLFYYRKFFKVVGGTVSPSIKQDKSFQLKPLNILSARPEQIAELFAKHETTKSLLFQLQFTGNTVPIANGEVRAMFTWSFEEDLQSLSAKLPNEIPAVSWPYGVSIKEMNIDLYDRIAKGILQKITPR